MNPDGLFRQQGPLTVDTTRDPTGCPRARKGHPFFQRSRWEAGPRRRQDACGLLLPLPGGLHWGWRFGKKGTSSPSSAVTSGFQRRRRLPRGRAARFKVGGPGQGSVQDLGDVKDLDLGPTLYPRHPAFGQSPGPHQQL